jgi:hypothetical protein
MEAFDGGATGAEAVNPYRNREERASPAHERTKYSLVRALVVDVA